MEVRRLGTSDAGSDGARQDDPGWLADYARGTLRLKKDELARAWQGHIGEHHRCVVRELREELAFLEGRITLLASEIEPRLLAHAHVIERLCTIPGVDRITAWTLLAELGVDKSAFADAAHLASWAGLCPGHCESAGKRKTGRTRKGNDICGAVCVRRRGRLGPERTTRRLVRRLERLGHQVTLLPQAPSPSPTAAPHVPHLR